MANIPLVQRNMIKIKRNKETLTCPGIKECFPKSIFQGRLPVSSSDFKMKVELKCNLSIILFHKRK